MIVYVNFNRGIFDGVPYSIVKCINRAHNCGLIGEKNTNPVGINHNPFWNGANPR